MGSQDRGLTLIEVIVTLARLGTALGAIAGMVQATFRSMLLTERTLEVQQNVRVAVDRMVEELRWGEAVLADARGGGVWPARLSGRRSPPHPPRPGQAYPVPFQRDRVQRERERRIGLAVNNLAGSIESLSFRYFDPAGAPATRPQDVVRVEGRVGASETSPQPPGRDLGRVPPLFPEI